MRSQLWQVAALLSLAAAPAVAAPVRWETGQGGNGHYYELVTESLSWPLARVAAAQRTPPAGYGPGHLASFSSAAEEAFLDSTFGTTGWIGFTDELVEGEWRWIDATPGIWQNPKDFASPIQTGYVDWAPGEPNGAQHENYVVFAWSGIRWNDGSGDPDVVFPYYVEYEPASTVACSNNIDDDGDGFVDYPNDPGCSSPTDDSERSPSIACDDGIDNDGDGAIDFPADPGCTAPSDLSEGPDCSDGFDNDGDGLVDFPADPDCGSPSDARESPGAQCSDGLDNDGDGFVDYPEDPECASPLDASESNLVLWDAAQGGNAHYYELVKTPISWPDARIAAEQRTPPAGYGPGHLASISSAAEDRFLWQTFRLDAPVFGGWMGFTDEVVEGEWRWIDGTPGIWQDPDNFPNPIQTVPYQNWAGGGGPGVEPNNAGNEDYATFGFVSDQWNDDGADGPAAAYYVEYEPAGPACSNHIDDDGDGLVDMEDPGCPFPEASPENPECDDGIDNDGNGLVDFADPKCSAAWPYWEEAPPLSAFQPPPVCGVGMELALVMPLLGWWHVRRRQARRGA